MTGTQSDRGQLILAGAVSFALILIAIAVVFSTTLFTASVGSSGSVETMSDSAAVEQSVNETTTYLLEWVNADGDRDHETLEGNISTYGELLANSSAESGPTFVDVSVTDIDDDGGDVRWVEVRVTYETSSVRRETTLNVSAP